MICMLIFKHYLLFVRADFHMPVKCSGCYDTIRDKFLLLALDQYWHDRCLNCDCCDASLAELGQSLYYKYGRKLCKNDYLR